MVNLVTIGRTSKTELGRRRVVRDGNDKRIKRKEVRDGACVVTENRPIRPKHPPFAAPSRPSILIPYGSIVLET